jgi:hypothetical protein
MPSSAIAPALLYLGHPCPRRQLLLHCSTAGIHARVVERDRGQRFEIGIPFVAREAARVIG